MQPLLNIAVRAARRAGELIVRSMNRLESLTITSKGRNDFVTEVDRAAEEEIIKTIRRHYPQHAFLAEESGRSGDNEFVWIIDPLDGTTNFAHAYPCFCVSMALARNNELLLGVIYNPIYQELFAAVRGEGATFNGKKISCSKIAALKNSLLCTGFPNHNRQANPNFHFYWDFTLRSHGVRRDGSAALDLAYVAMGRFDSFWEFGLNPWDVAAGIVLVEEAGGKITDFQGQPYSLGGSSILASNGLIHDEMVSVAAEVSGQLAARR